MKVFLAVLLGLVVAAQAQDANPTHVGSLPVLIGHQVVEQDLGLSASQRGKIDKIRSSFRKDARALVAVMPATEQGRREAEVALNKLRVRSNEAAFAVLSPAQQKRVRQIEIQALGGSALTSPAIQKELGLSASQVAKIKALQGKLDDFVGRVNRQFVEGKISFPKRISLLQAERLDVAKDLKAVLTPEQLKSFTALGGKQLDVSA